jgi:hypothetical protein
MQYLARALVPALLAIALGGCASSGASPGAQANAPQKPAAAPAATFTSNEAKLLACLDLRDHIVDLYATQYVTQQGLSLSTEEKTAFRNGWAEELAKKGTFDRFERSCFSGLTPKKYQCGMQSTTPGGIVACMKLI